MMDSLGVLDLEAMAAAGVKVLISDAAGGMDVATSSEAAIQYYERILAGETKRAADYFIEVYTILGINMFAVPPDYEIILEKLPIYLQHERVVGIGEIGLEPRSSTCPDLDKQEEILKSQLKMAREHDKAVVLHWITPEDAAKIVADNDINHVLVSSDTRVRHRSDPLGVPRTALQMKRLGFKDEDITKVFYDNPKRVFKLNL